jgi:nucleotide-binding universal stress UspA family protein
VREPVETSFDVGQLLQKRAAVNEKLENYLRVKLDEHVLEALADGDVQQIAIPIASGTKRSDALVQWVKDSDVDFVILGAKGQSAAEAFFLGSFAEDVYSRLNRQVLLLFKKPGENHSFLRLLLGKLRGEN